MNANVSFLVLLITIIKLGYADLQNEIQIIKDILLNKQARNIGVSAYLCWNRKNKTSLSNKLFESNYAVSIFNVDDKSLQYLYPSYEQLYILDLDSPKFENILHKANNMNLFAPYYTWVLLTRSFNILDKISDITVNLNMYQNSDIILVRKVETGGYFIHEIYKEKHNGNLNVNKIFFWNNNDKSLKYFKSRNLANERKNLNKIVLGVASVMFDNDTLNHLDDYRFKHTDSVTKVTYVVIKHMIEYLNATLKIYPVDTWGYYNNSKMFTGMIGSMQINESELGGTGLFITRERLLAIDYLGMVAPTKLRFIFRQPPLSYQQNIFTLPFTKNLWMCSFCFVLLSIFLLYATVYWEWTSTNYQDESSSLRNSFLDCVMLTFAAVAQQGTPTEPRSGPGKLIMIIIFIALMFLYVSYSANIVALLQSPATNIKTLKDLLESRLKVGADDTVYNKYYMSVAKEATRKAIYEQKIAPMGQVPHFLPLADGIKKVREGFYAYHMELGRGYALVEDTFFESEKCGIQEIKFLDVDNAYLSVTKNSTYKEMFTLGLRKLRESGIQSRELSKIYTKKPDCHIAGGLFVSVGLIDSYPAFVFLGAGIGLALLLCILEIIFNKPARLNQICLTINK